MFVTDDGIDTLLKLVQSPKADCARTRARDTAVSSSGGTQAQAQPQRVQSCARELGCSACMRACHAESGSAPPDEAMRTPPMLVTDDGIDTLLNLEQSLKADCA